MNSLDRSAKANEHSHRLSRYGKAEDQVVVLGTGIAATLFKERRGESGGAMNDEDLRHPELLKLSPARIDWERENGV
jgi:hypothetical protein